MKNKYLYYVRPEHTAQLYTHLDNLKDTDNLAVTLFAPPNCWEVDKVFAEYPYENTEFCVEWFVEHNALCFSRSLNRVFRADRDVEYNYVVPNLNQDVHYPPFEVSTENLRKIGYFTEYLKSPFWAVRDWHFRAKLLGLDIEYFNPFSRVSHDVLEDGVRANEFSILWQIPADVPFDKQLEFVLNNHEWSETLRQS